MICYHFCSKDFLNELINKKQIIPDRKYVANSSNNRLNAYNYLYDKIGVNSLFFSWGSKENKNEEIKYLNDSDTVLLTLDVPDEELIVTDYYNWCDVIFCLDEVNTLQDAEEVAQNDMKCSFETVYDSVFHLDANSNIQVLLKSIKYDWIKDIEFVESKII